jgi:hypothetical protein
MPSPTPRCADLDVGDHVRLCAPLHAGVVGIVVEIGADLVFVEVVDGPILPFLPVEIEPRDTLKAVEARYA